MSKNDVNSITEGRIKVANLCNTRMSETPTNIVKKSSTCHRLPTCHGRNKVLAISPMSFAQAQGERMKSNIPQKKNEVQFIGSNLVLVVRGDTSY